ncbi:MarR family transcriptional regulator [Aquamicrobium sp. LC103]|uniref:helix-turn-helix transcriptional regulator n=1 Tax=Aquamicrobium sp. LC103 TaxID=1120658 RepID=UPI000A584655|nr:MarR family transcriptional regulator [Aquamicrobium sp. LC103]
MALKMHGALSSARLGELLKITGEAARQQLTRLAEDGLVEAAPEIRGVGRPRQNWSLTAKAQARFPDTHADLTVQLLGIVRAELGEQALERMISKREELTRRGYAQALERCSDLKQKVALLAAIRSGEGYMAEWREEEDGSLTLIENHCPICAAAAACRGFCRAEMEVFQSVLGPDVAIAREEHLLSGGRRCTYSIRERAEQPAS